MRRNILLFVLMLIFYAYVLPRWADWSQNSRLDLVLALVDDRTITIDRYIDNTGDYAIYQGHAYSDKAPGPVMMSITWYQLARPILDSPFITSNLTKIAQKPALAETLRSDGNGTGATRVRFAVIQYILSICTIAIPSALLILLFDNILRFIGLSNRLALICTLAYGLGTPAAIYAGNLYAHQLVAVLLFGAFWLAWMTSRDDRQAIPARALLSGLLLSWAAISEYPAVLAAAAVALYTLYKQGQRWLLFAAAGGLLPIVLMVVHNLVAFSTPWPISYAYSAYWGQQFHSGMMSMTYPQPKALWGLAFGLYRGLFIRAPWLLLALPGYVIWWRSGRLRAEWWLCLTVPLSLYLPYSSSEFLWWGGNAAGPRYLVGMLPFLALPAAWYIHVRFERLWERAIALGLIGLSIMAVWIEGLAGQAFPPEQYKQPWLEYIFPAWAKGDIARNLGMFFGLKGWLSLLPLIVTAVGLIWIANRTSAESIRAQAYHTALEAHELDSATASATARPAEH